MSETIEAFGYIASFWMFVFNRTYREACVSEWREAEAWQRAFLVFEAVVSVGVGVVLPLAMLWAIVSRIAS